MAYGGALFETLAAPRLIPTVTRLGSYVDEDGSPVVLERVPGSTLVPVTDGAA